MTDNRDGLVIDEGWGFPLNSHKAHYFVGPVSLCSKWMFVGKLEPAGKKSPDDCKVCTRKLAERMEKVK